MTQSPERIVHLLKLAVEDEKKIQGDLVKAAAWMKLNDKRPGLYNQLRAKRKEIHRLKAALEYHKRKLEGII